MSSRDTGVEEQCEKDLSLEEHRLQTEYVKVNSELWDREDPLLHLSAPK